MLSPHFSGQGSSRKGHVVATWLSWSFLLIVKPQAQTTSPNGQPSMCCWRSFLLTGWRQKLQSTGNNTHRRTWSFALSSVNFSWQYTHLPSSLSKTEFANRFLQNPVTFVPHFWHVLSVPCVWNLFTQNPQKLCPHGVAISASKKRLSLKKKG